MSWYHIDIQRLVIETDLFTYAYGHGYLHNGEGVSITRFVHKPSGVNSAYGFDGQYKANAWDTVPATITQVVEGNETVDIHIQTGQTRKIDRIYRDMAAIHIIYQENNADWTEDFIGADGESEDITFAMYGLPDVVGLHQGKAIWDASEQLCGHNYGDCFIRAAGGTLDGCIYKKHFIYGFFNKRTGCGAGFVYPTWITTHEWKVWWTESHKIEIEYAPAGKTGERLIFAVAHGRDELIDIGKRWLDRYVRIP